MKNINRNYLFNKIVGGLLLALAVIIAISTFKEIFAQNSFYSDTYGGGFEIPTNLIIDCITFLVIGIVGAYIVFSKNEFDTKKLSIFAGLGVITIIKSFYLLSEYLKMGFDTGDFSLSLSYFFEGLAYLCICLICVVFLLKPRYIKDEE